MEAGSPANLRSLFDQALDLDPAARAAWLREMQESSPELFRQLRELLLAHEESHEFFENFEREGNLWASFAPPSLIGRRIGSYVVESEIGRGGMGTVYKASRADDVFYKTVAIKFISGGGSLSETALASFRRERQILAQLEHPNIARLLDAGATDDGLLYLVMEFVDGLPIDDYIRKKSASFEEILRLFIAVCEAVAFAHRNLVVHRDLKPSNILVDRDGQIKLLDFGIAKVLSPERRVTATLALRLTPEFASPEHIRGEAISTVSDVYSLGVVLFHLLTAGAQPYRTTSRAVPDLLQAVLESEVPKPSTVAPPNIQKRLRGDLDNIILKAMEKEAARRYASVDQLSEDLRRHIAGLPVYARPATLRYRSLKFWQRHKLVVTATILLLLTIGSGVISTLKQAEIAERERARAERERAAAIQAQSNEATQRQVAELRSREAEAERSKAESRYQNVRSLATAILNDVNDSLRDVPGSGPARRKAVLAALTHLEELSRKSGNDPQLSEDLAHAYEQTGEILRGLFPAGQETSQMEIPALEKAVGLRTQILAGNPQAASAQLNLSAAIRMLGNSYLRGQQHGKAVVQYRKSLAVAEKAPASREAKLLQAQAHANLCSTLSLQVGSRQALAHCSSAVNLLDGMEGQRGLLLATRLKQTAILAKAGQNSEATKALQAAIDGMDVSMAEAREGAAEALQLCSLLPASNSLAAQAERVLAVSYARAGSRDQALEHFEAALQRLGRQTPTMREVLDYATAAERLAEGRILLRQGQTRRAHELLSESLAQLTKKSEEPASLLRSEFENAISAAELKLAQTAR